MPESNYARFTREELVDIIHGLEEDLAQAKEKEVKQHA
jgi:hypothetical protein